MSETIIDVEVKVVKTEGERGYTATARLRPTIGRERAATKDRPEDAVKQAVYRLVKDYREELFG